MSHQTRKRSRANNADNLDGLLKHQNPVTVTEKLNLLAVEFDKLKIEQQLCKDQVLICQQETAEWKQTSDELRAEICKLKTDHQLHADQYAQSQRELSELKKMTEDLRAVVESKLVATPVANSLAKQTASSIDEPVMMRAMYNKLPCKNLDEYEQLKTDLANVNLFVFMERRLGSIGGADPRSCFVAILNRLLGPEVQRNLSLTGKRTTKPGVMDTVILELVHCAVRVTHPNYKDKDGEAIIGKIFLNK